MNPYINHTFTSHEVIDLVGCRYDMINNLCSKFNKYRQATPIITPIGKNGRQSLFSYDQLLQISVFKEFSDLRIGSKWSEFIANIDHTSDVIRLLEDGKVSIKINIKKIKLELNEKIEKMKG